MNFFHHKDLGNHLLQLCPKVVKHSVYIKQEKYPTERFWSNENYTNYFPCPRKPHLFLHPTLYLKISTCLFCAEVSLIWAITTIILRVTLPGGRNTASIITAELWKCTGHIDTASLVWEVSTVVLRITFETARNTASCSTLELSCPTRGLCTIKCDFINLSNAGAS